MYFRLRSAKLLLILLIGALMPWPGAVPPPATAQAAAPAQSLLAPTEPVEIVPDATNFTLIGGGIFWTTEVFVLCPIPAGQGRVTVTSTVTPEIPAIGEMVDFLGRVPTSGVGERRLFEKALPPSPCDTPHESFLSNLAVDNTDVYWISPEGLVRLSRNANVGDQPQLVVAGLQPGTLRSLNQYILAALADGIYRIEKSSGAMTQLVQGATKGLVVDNAGNFYYTDMGANLWTRTISGGPPQLMGPDVTAFYAENQRSVCTTASSCVTTHYVYFAQHNPLSQFTRIIRVNRADNSAATIYTSSFQSDHEITITGITSAVSGNEMPILYFWEKRTPPCDNLGCPAPLKVLVRRIESAGVISEDVVYETVGLDEPEAEVLAATDKYVFWRENDFYFDEDAATGPILRLPHTAGAIPQIDLKIDDVEVTQGLQDENNSVRLIQKRRTFVRVYVHAEGQDSVPGVTAHLFAEGQSGYLEPINGLYGGTPTKTISVKRLDLRGGRETLDDSFLFELPWQWTADDSLKLKVKLNPGQAIPERKFDDDNTKEFTFSFEQAGKLRLNVYPYSYSIGGVTYTPTQEEYDAFHAMVRQVFPVANHGGPNMSEGFAPYYYPLTYDDELGYRVHMLGDYCEDLEEKITMCASKYLRSRLAQAWESMGGGFGPHLALFKDFPLFNPRSSASTDAQTAAATTDRPLTTMAHEFAHMLGRNHPFLGSTEDPNRTGTCRHGPDDGSYTYPPFFDNADGRIGPDGGTMMGFKFDPSASPAIELMPQATSYDFMGYCENYWISDDNYDALYAMQSYPQEPPSDDFPPINKPTVGDWFNIQGTLIAEGGSQVIANQLAADQHHPEHNAAGEALYTSAILYVNNRLSSAVVGDPPALGPYSVQMVGRNGSILATYSFTPVVDHHAQSLADFGMVVPWVAGTAQIRIVYQNGGAIANPLVLKQVAVSARPPQVSNVSIQNPTNPVSGSVTLNWQASDADNDPLTFDVYYSRNHGQSFLPLLLGVKGSSAPVDTNLVGGGAVIFRVLANDGVQTHTADSPVYTLADKPPRTRILTPHSHIALIYGQNLNLEGEAQDVQDGYVAEEQMVWTNQQGVEVGRGSVLSLRNLPAGTTRITLTATNSRGLSASDSIDLAVNDVLDPLGPTLAAGPSTINWVVQPGASKQTAMLSISNSGSGNLDWVVEESEDWLSLSSEPSNQGSGPTQIVMSGDPAGVPPGTTRTATIRVRTRNLSPEQLVTIQVKMSVGQLADALVVGDGTPASCNAAALTSVLQAVHAAQGGRIRFNCGAQRHMIDLSSLLVIQVPVVIEGNGLITLKSTAGRIFQVCNAAEQGAQDVELQLDGLTLIGGSSSPNQAGGAITNYGCRVTVRNSQFIDNRAFHEAGAINSLFGGTLIVENSLFSGNQANTIGGAIVTQSGSLVVRNSVFRNNRANGGNGGAIYAYEPATVSIEGSSFIANHSVANGGALSLGGATIANSTFWQNTAGLSGKAIRMHTANEMVELVNVTIVGEQGPSLNGGFTMRNSLVSNTTGAANCQGTIIAVGPNLEYPGTSCHASISGQEPQLAPLAEHPGLTPVLPLTAGSPARDAGDNSICAAAPVNGVDQRGGQRPLPSGSVCDLGALEFNPVQSLLPVSANAEPQPLELQQFNHQIQLPMIGK